MSNKAIDIHVTERTAFKLCRAYWDFSYKRRLTTLKRSFGPLWFGTGIHIALATYYRSGRNPADHFRRWFYEQMTIDEWQALTEDDQKRLRDFLDLGVGMMTAYLPYARLNDNWEVVSVEQPLGYEVLPGVKIVGSLDLLVRKNGKLWIVDHKTCASFIDPEVLVYDDQMALYLWLVWKTSGEVPGGVIYSMLRKKLPVEPMLVYGGTALSKSKSVDTTYEKYMQAIARYGFDSSDYREILEKVRSNEFFRRETVVRSARELSVFDSQIELEAKEMSRPNIPIYPTLTHDCLWSCQYRDLCRTRLTGGDVEFTIKSKFQEYDESERYVRWLEVQEV